MSKTKTDRAHDEFVERLHKYYPDLVKLMEGGAPEPKRARPETKRIDLYDLIPDNIDPLNIPNWRSRLKIAFLDEKTRDAFRRETGNAYRPPRSQMAMMIDEATGVVDDYFKAFVQWWNETRWSDPIGCPEAEAHYEEWMKSKG